MKPDLLCSRMPPELFERPEFRHQAARFCAQCVSKEACFAAGVATKAKTAVWGGCWFNKQGKPVVIDAEPQPGPFRMIGAVDEDLTEVRLRLAQRPYGVPNRHDVWRIGSPCQRSSKHRGIPCMDPICQEIARGRDRLYRRMKKDERRERAQAAAADHQRDGQVRNAPECSESDPGRSDGADRWGRAS